jgi:hypothetical protein
VDVEQFTELTSTNRSCGLTISLGQTSKLRNRAPGIPWRRGSRARAQDSGCIYVLRASLGAPMKDNPKVSGGDFEEATPDPIPNSEVKLFGADGTAREAVWESRTLPGFLPSPPQAGSFFCARAVPEDSALTPAR